MYKLIVLLMVGSVHAATIFTLNDKRTIETHLSNRDFNRIAIEKDRIANIFYDRDAFSVVHDKANGQIIVKPNDEPSKYPLGFTITTEKNKTQDWLFSFRNVKARTLILQDVERDVVKAPSCEEEAVKLLNQLINHEDIKGLKNKVKTINVTSNWKLKILKQIKRDNLKGYVLTLRNNTDVEQEISVKELWRDSILAINIDKPKIEPHGNTEVFMVTDERGLNERRK